MSVTDKSGNTYPVVDADGHAWEIPLGMWDRYVPTAYRPVWRSGLDPNGHWRTLFDGKLFMQHEVGPVPVPSAPGRASVRVWPLMSRGQGPGTPRDAAIAAGGG